MDIKTIKTVTLLWHESTKYKHNCWQIQFKDRVSNVTEKYNDKIIVNTHVN